MDVERYGRDCPSLQFTDAGDDILEIALGDDDNLNAADASMHADLAYVWSAIDRDPDVSAVLVRGGKDRKSVV